VAAWSSSSMVVVVSDELAVVVTRLHALSSDCAAMLSKVISVLTLYGLLV
jgi:hypothetical protein